MREQLVAWRGDEIRPSFGLAVRSLIISYEYHIYFPPESLHLMFAIRAFQMFPDDVATKVQGLRGQQIFDRARWWNQRFVVEGARQ